MLRSAATVVAKPKEERSLRREIMTASLAGLPQVQSLLAFAAFVLIYVIGRQHSQADTAPACTRIAACLPLE